MDSEVRHQRNRALYLSEVHSKTNLREQVHDDALVFLHRFALTVIIAVIVTVEGVWGRRRQEGLELSTDRIYLRLLRFFFWIDFNMSKSPFNTKLKSYYHKNLNY